VRSRLRRLGIVNHKTVLGIALMSACILVPGAHASLIGTVLTVPGGSVFPGFVAGNTQGTLLASESVPFISSLSTEEGTLVSAVYKESGGTLDFYYQVTNNVTSSDDLARETNTNFLGYTTYTGFLPDATGLTSAGFVNGTIAPQTADSSSGGSVIGFVFGPLPTEEIPPGSTSNVLVISTNATSYTSGNASVIDGGTTTLAAYEPTSLTVPEPASLLLVGAGLLILGKSRKTHSRRAA